MSESSASYELTRFNALRHGILSRYTVLPWEDACEYDRLLSSLVQAWTPAGAIEEHLTEEIAGVLWRKRRLRLAEAALHKAELHDVLGESWREQKIVPRALAHLETELDPIERAADAIRASQATTEAELEDLAGDRRMTDAALRVLEKDGGDSYQSALAALRDDTREWWARKLADDGENPPTEPYRADTPSLKRFLTMEVLAWYDTRQLELKNRAAIKDQVLGEAVDVAELERLARYEVHLDRKFERMIAMLVRLQEMRKASPAL